SLSTTQFMTHLFCVFSTDPPPPDIYTLSLHDALPISPSTSVSWGLTGIIRYPARCMYSDTSWLGRIGFDDNPTTAIVLYLRKMPAIGSPPLCAPNSDPSGTSTLIASLLPSLLSSVL